MRNKILNQKGFTLTEMLISTAIIAIISATFVGNIRYGGERGRLNIAAQRVISDLRQVQDFALGLKEYDDGGTLVYPDGGWGIHFTTLSNSYTLYADHGDGSGGEKNKVMDADEEYFINNMEKTTVTDILIDGTSRNDLYAVFEPPDPTIHLCWDAVNCATEDAIIELMDNDEYRSVFINMYGVVDVYNPDVNIPAIVVIPNARSGLACKDVCQGLGVGFDCRGPCVGYDKGGTNRRYLEAPLCNPKVANRNTVISDARPDMCDGKPANWIYCLCTNFN